jgi:hypothetical protein
VKFSLHIDQVVVEGTSLTRREREHLAATLEQELARQLRQRAAGERANHAGSGPGAGARQDQDARSASLLGSRIAHEVLAALPAGALPAGRAARVPAPGRRQLRRRYQ